MGPGMRHDGDPTFRELLGTLGQDVAALLHDEIDLVTKEMRSELRTSFVLLGTLSAVSMGAIVTLCAAAVLGLARVLDPALAALAVGGTLLVLAGGIAIAARRWRRTMDLIPEDAMEVLREDHHASDERALIEQESWR